MALIIDPQRPGGTGEIAADVVKDGDTEHFAADVLDASLQVPVIVDFWAPWCGPCKQLGPMLERLVREARGLVRLVKINVDENQELAAQLRVQSIPMVYAFVGGQPVDAFVGAQPESKLKAFIDRLTHGAKTPLDDALERAQKALEAGDHRTAAAVFSQVLAEDASNAKAIAGLVRCRVATGNVAGARQLLAGLPKGLAGNADIAAAAAAVELAEQAESSGDVKALRDKLEANPEDLQVRFDLANALFAAGQAGAAIDELLEIIRRDRTWNNDAARTQLLKIFDALGPTSPVTTAARRRLSSLLFS